MMETSDELDRTVENVKRFIMRKLGAGEYGVDVELDALQLQDCVDESLMWWGGICGWYREADLNIPPSGGMVDVPADCEEVSHVFFDDSQNKVVDIYDWAGFYSAPIGYNSFRSSGQISSFVVQTQTYLEEAKKVFSSDPDWAYNRDTRKLSVFTGAGISANVGPKIRIMYTVSVPDILKLHGYEYDMVRRYALACSMETLGNIRSKWAEVPSAQGSTTMNGDLLLSNAESMKADLEERAKGFRRPLEFFSF